MEDTLRPGQIEEVGLDLIFRPKRFSEFCGNQEAIMMLQNHIRYGTLPQVLLLCGQPGIGKTTLSFILTAAILCENKQDSEPCWQCESCKTIADTLYVDGNAIRGMDVFTFNMSSHESSDAYIKHIASVIAAPVRNGKKKIVIIEELHKAQIDQQESLNNILEFPPKGVYVLICTSIVKKIARAVQKRGILLQLNTADSETLLKRLRVICMEQAQDVSDAKLQKIMKAANNNGRHTLKYLQEVFNGGDLAMKAIINKSSLQIDMYLKYFEAIRLGVLPIMEFVEDTVKDSAIFFSGLDDFIYLVMKTRYYAGGIGDEAMRKTLKETMIFFSDAVLINILKSSRGAGYVSDEEARKLLFVIGFDANPKIVETLNNPDSQNSIAVVKSDDSEELVDSRGKAGLEAFDIAFKHAVGVSVDDL